MTTLNWNHVGSDPADGLEEVAIRHQATVRVRPDPAGRLEVHHIAASVPDAPRSTASRRRKQLRGGGYIHAVSVSSRGLRWSTNIDTGDTLEHVELVL